MRGGGGAGRRGKTGVRALSWDLETPWREDDPTGPGNVMARSSEDAQERWPQWGALDFQQVDCELKQTQIHMWIRTTFVEFGLMILLLTKILFF